MNHELYLDATNENAMSEGLRFLDLMSADDLALGVSFVSWPPGSLADQHGGTPNATHWGNVLYSCSDDEWDMLVVHMQSTSVPMSKESLNGHGDSQWYGWGPVQMPSLGTGEQFRVFRESYSGKPKPESPRMVWAR